MIASQVAGAAQSASANAQVDAQLEMANRATAVAMNAMTQSIADQRKERLMGLFEAKRC